MRLFVGLPLPQQQRQALEQQLAPWRAEHPRLKWVDAHLYHFTLQFLGDVDPDRAPSIMEALSELNKLRDFSLETGAAFAMPPGNRARVLTLGLLSGMKSLRDLATAVQDATAGVGFEPERRDFKAHLTLARVRRGEKLELDPDQIGTPQLPMIRAESFQLYESELRPRGPIYRSLLEVQLSDR